MMKPVAVFFMMVALATLACGRGQASPTLAPTEMPAETALSGPTELPTLPASVTPVVQPPPSSASTVAAPAPVPAEYQSLYSQLSTTLDGLRTAFPAQGGKPPVFAAELSYANGNIGEGLLRPEILPMVRQQLDQLAQMGVRGVVVAINFPMVEPAFPRSAEYLQFFKQVAAEVRQRQMKLLVESGALFSGTAFSPLSVDWSQYPDAEAFRSAEIHQLQTIAREIQPDYLQIATEPTTTAMLTHFSDTPDDYAAFVRRAVQALPRQANMLIGAGAGMWEDQTYVTRLFSVDGLDFIDLHLYPLGQNGNLLRAAASLAGQAHTAGKRLVISEAWLYKTDTGLGYQAADFTTIIGRDVYSFWEPLDEEFIQATTGLARAGQIEFVSFFWTRAFYAYLDYDQVRLTPLDRINPVINQASVANEQKGVLSPLVLLC